jgi:serine protease inhibitor
MLATAADIVADPSAPDAFVQGIMEGVEWVYDSSRNSWLIENTKKKIDTLVDKHILEEYKLSLFNEFLNSL